MRVDEAGALPSGRVVLSRAVWRYYDPLRLPGGRLPLPGLAGYRQALLPEPRRLGATEGLSSSHDNLPTVPRPLRRRVPWHPLQAPRCRPWPSPSEYRLGSLLAACAVILNDAAGFASCCGPVGCPPRTGGGLPPPRPRALTRRRECCYRGPWRLPGPDSHRLAAVSLSLGYVVVPSFRWSSAPELLDAHSGGITDSDRCDDDARITGERNSHAHLVRLTA
jgi:hypothetical protein